MSAPTNTMKYVRLGNSGLKVSRIVIGTGPFGKTASPIDSWKLDEDASGEVIKAAYDLGINTFDASNLYGNGISERILGAAIKKYDLPRDEIVIITKAWGLVAKPGDDQMYWNPTDEQIAQGRYVNQCGLSRKHLFEAIKHSLERLQLDYVDVYQCHRFDYDTPIEETMHALHDIVKAGYARYIGMGSCHAWQFYKMQAYARANGLTEFTHLEAFYTPIYREEEREMIPLLKDLGCGLLVWSPLAGGALGRKSDVTTPRKQADYIGAMMRDVPYLEDMLKLIENIAKERNATMAQITLAWLLSKPGVTAPTIGVTSVERLKDSIGALEVKLTPEDIASIDALYRPRGVFGHI